MRRGFEEEGELDIHGFEAGVVDKKAVSGVVFNKLNKLGGTIAPGFGTFLREENKNGAPDLESGDEKKEKESRDVEFFLSRLVE